MRKSCFLLQPLTTFFDANLVLLCAQFYGSFYCNSMGKLSINSGSCSEFQIAMRLNIQQMTMRQKNHRFYRFSWSFDVSHSKRWERVGLLFF